MTRQGALSTSTYQSSVGRVAVESGIHMILWVSGDHGEAFPPPRQVRRTKSDNIGGGVVIGLSGPLRC